MTQPMRKQESDIFLVGRHNCTNKASKLCSILLDPNNARQNMESSHSKEGCTGFLGFSGEEVLAFDDVQRDPAGERDASLGAFLAS
jgi:hypothetical protein